MKNLITILILVFTFQFINAQKFIKTDKYNIVSKVGTKQQEYTVFFDVITKDIDASKIGTIRISDLESFDDISIRVLLNPNLENIKEVVKVETNYSACCGYTETFYFMITNDSDFISLPHIENTYCEDAISEVQYLFPTQKFGKDNMILKTEVTYTEDIETIKKTQVIQSLVWNDEMFDNNESITSVIKSY